MTNAIPFPSATGATHPKHHSQYSDMPEEMKSECVELSMTACEKFANNYEVNWKCT